MSKCSQTSWKSRVQRCTKRSLRWSSYTQLHKCTEGKLHKCTHGSWRKNLPKYPKRGLSTSKWILLQSVANMYQVSNWSHMCDKNKHLFLQHHFLSQMKDNGWTFKDLFVLTQIIRLSFLSFKLSVIRCLPQFGIQ